jgi:hypothetical protein
MPLRVKKLSPDSCKTLARAAAVVVAATAAIVLIGGWLCGIALLRSVLPGLATMKANAAVAFLAAGVALWLRAGAVLGARSAYIAQASAALVLIIGCVTLSEYLFAWNPGIDEWLVRDTRDSPGTGGPGRMASGSAALFVVIGGALLILDRPTPGFTLFLVLFGLAGSYLALMGYVYGPNSLYQLPPYSSMALHTAAS